MISQRQLFYQYIAQTTPQPLALEIKKARGIYFTDISGKKYLDLVSGVCTSNVGHGNQKVVNAVKKQVGKFMHLMVYGEYIQSPQVEYAGLLAKNLPGNLNNVYFVNSGSEAVEGAIKLAKRFTGRFEVISFVNAYHGSTQGALSVMGNETLKNAFRPLIPGHHCIRFNNFEDLDQITSKTACVIAEPIQAEAGVILPQPGFLEALREKCNKTGTLLIFDEIQTGFGRTGQMFAMQHSNIIPDIVCLAKSMGGGMPLGAFIASREIMASLAKNPSLGHITTFGGHPVCCAAGMAAFQYITHNNLCEEAARKEHLFRSQLNHPAIKQIRGKGLLLAVDLGEHKKVIQVIESALQKGIILDYFLFCNTAFRIAPPLIISDRQIYKCCSTLNQILDKYL